MPALQEALLEKRLRSQRIGTLIRASLPPATFNIVKSLKEETRRTYRDIFTIVLNVFKHHPHFFPITNNRQERKDLSFRVANEDSMTVHVWAWKRRQRRSNFIGDLMEQFLAMVPIAEFKTVLYRRTDQAFRLKEDIKRYERA